MCCVVHCNNLLDPFVLLFNVMNVITYGYINGDTEHGPDIEELKW